jgi:hypothetical protein
MTTNADDPEGSMPTPQHRYPQFAEWKEGEGEKVTKFGCSKFEFTLKLDWMLKLDKHVRFKILHF